MPPRRDMMGASHPPGTLTGVGWSSGCGGRVYKTIPPDVTHDSAVFPDARTHTQIDTSPARMPYHHQHYHQPDASSPAQSQAALSWGSAASLAAQQPRKASAYSTHGIEPKPISFTAAAAGGGAGSEHTEYSFGVPDHFSWPASYVFAESASRPGQATSGHGHSSDASSYGREVRIHSPSSAYSARPSTPASSTLVPPSTTLSPTFHGPSSVASRFSSSTARGTSTPRPGHAYGPIPSAPVLGMTIPLPTVSSSAASYSSLGGQEYTHAPLTPASSAALAARVPPPVSAGIVLHPRLNPGRLWFDFALPPGSSPTQPNFITEMHHTAFSAPVPNVRVCLAGRPGWECFAYAKAETGVTVFDILYAVYEFLHKRLSSAAGGGAVLDQGAGWASPPLSSAESSTGTSRHSRTRGADAQTFHAGVRRIDLLGRARVFYGLEMSSEPGVLILHLCAPPTTS